MAAKVSCMGLGTRSDLLLVAIVMLAVFKTLFDALWGALALVTFGVLLAVAVKLVRGGKPRAPRSEGGAVEVSDHTLGHEPVDHVVQPAFDEQHLLLPEVGRTFRDEAPEHPPEEQELGHDLARREAERLPLARVVARLGRQGPAQPPPLRLRLHDLAGEGADQGRHVAELPEPAETLQRGHLVVQEAFFGRGDSKLPGVARQRGRQLLERGCRLRSAHRAL